MCIGIAKAHEINTGRAVLAVLTPMVICCVGAGIFGGSLALLSEGVMQGAATEQTVD